VADGVPHVALLRGADVLALHVVLDALQQVGETARQDAQFVRPARSETVEVADALVDLCIVDVVRHRSRALCEPGDAANQPTSMMQPRQCDRASIARRTTTSASRRRSSCGRGCSVAGQRHFVAADRRGNDLFSSSSARNLPRAGGG
jgi:hypothetical protein